MTLRHEQDPGQHRAGNHLLLASSLRGQAGPDRSRDTMASVDQVEDVLVQLLSRLGEVDDATRAILPSLRTIEASCPDLGLVRHALWRRGDLELLDDVPPRRPDIRISVHSDDLLAIAAGDLPFSRALASNRLRLDASMADLIRLRAVL